MERFSEKTTLDLIDLLDLLSEADMIVDRLRLQFSDFSQRYYSTDTPTNDFLYDMQYRYRLVKSYIESFEENISRIHEKLNIIVPQIPKRLGI